MYNHSEFLESLSPVLFKYLEISNKIITSENGLSLIPSIVNEIPKYKDVVDSIVGKVIRVSVEFSPIINKDKRYTNLIKLTKFDFKEGLIGDGFKYDYRCKPLEYITDINLPIDYNGFHILGGDIISAKVVSDKEFIDKVKALLKHSGTKI